MLKDRKCFLLLIYFLRVTKCFPKARNGSLFTSEFTANKRNILTIITLDLQYLLKGLGTKGDTRTSAHTLQTVSETPPSLYDFFKPLQLSLLHHKLPLSNSHLRACNKHYG